MCCPVSDWLKEVKTFVVWSYMELRWPRRKAQIRKKMSGPDLYVFTLKFLALKKRVFSLFRGQTFFFLIP